MSAVVDGDGGALPVYELRPRPKVPSAVIGTALFLFAEATLFAGLVSADVLLRSRFDRWPPLGQPRLPVEITGANTLVLLASAVTMAQAVTALRDDDRPRTLQRLGLTFALGATFLAVQGVEWVRLVGYGLTTSSSVYGGLFYTIVGFHALHVVVALAALGVVALRARAGRYTRAKADGLLAMRLYWWFVVGVWPVLYALVYLW